MVVKFKRLTFQNILSFGASPTTIDFKHGVNLISGKNGSGKSALLDALSFCLYGKPYRSIKIKELLNRRNKRNLKVTCEFMVDNNDEFVVTRTLTPDKLEILKNGEELELLSSKRLNQEELDKIVGIDHTMFRQVISLAVNYNRPFLSLGLWEKREIIEQIFNIVVFGQMLKVLKKKNVDIRTKAEVNDRSVALLEQHLKSLRKRVLELTDAQNNFQSNKANDLSAIDDRIKAYLNDKIDIEAKISDISKQITLNEFEEATLKELKASRDKIIRYQNGKEYNIKSSTKTIKSLESHTVCPLCQTEITPEHKESEIDRLAGEIEKDKSIIDDLQIDRKEAEDKIREQEDALKELNTLQFSSKSLKDKLEMIDRELAVAEERRNEILNREIEFNLGSVQEEFEERKDEYKLLWKETEGIKKTLKNNDVIQGILSESGIKAYFFKKLIPILNSKINEYIKLFELPAIIQFDEFMNEKITNLDNLKNDISYYSYSEGEKKRIDMSILLSFISITKTISNWNCNLLIIDELLDSAIDENGLEKLVGSLKTMAYDNKDLCVYIISHRLQQDYSSQFSSCLQVQKNGNSFSEINQMKEVMDG